MSFAALLDACVLFPPSVRDSLLRIEEAGLFRPRWTERILAEVRRNVLERYPDLGPQRFEPTLQAMREAFEDAEVVGYEQLVDSMTNDVKDRHVLAAALVGRVDAIVTDNVRDFPSDACEPFGIQVQTADEFLTHALHLDPPLVIEVLRLQAADKRSPPMTLDDLLATLARSVPKFVSEINRVRESDGP